MLGKTTDGKLLFGYARLPWLDYLEPALSAREPKVVKKDCLKITVEVQNFGQVTSKPTKLLIVDSLPFRKPEVATGRITSYNVCYTKLLR